MAGRALKHTVGLLALAISSLACGQLTTSGGPVGSSELETPTYVATPFPTNTPLPNTRHLNKPRFQYGGYMIRDRIQAHSSITFYAGSRAPDSPTTLSHGDVFWRGGDMMDISYDEAEIGRFRCGRKPDVEGQIIITLNCYTNPQTVTIRNDSDRPIVINRIAAQVRKPPASMDDYRLDDAIQPSGSLIYYAGSKASTGRTTLRRSPLFTDAKRLLHIELTIGGRRVWENMVCGLDYLLTDNGERDDRGRQVGGFYIMLDCEKNRSLIVVDSRARVPIKVTRIAVLVEGDMVYLGPPPVPVLFTLRLDGKTVPGEGFYVQLPRAWRPEDRVWFCGHENEDMPTPTCQGGGTTYRKVWADPDGCPTKLFRVTSAGGRRVVATYPPKENSDTYRFLSFMHRHGDGRSSMSSTTPPIGAVAATHPPGATSTPSLDCAPGTPGTSG